MIELVSPEGAMHFNRRTLVGGAAASLAAPFVARAQGAWPQGRTIKIVVPFPPGGATDVIARIMADKLARMWSAGVIVENKAGAGGNIGNEQVARAEPNGDTILMASPGLATNPFLYEKINYDPIGDFTHVSLVALVPNILVMHPDRPFKSVADIIAYAKANPGKLTYASSGVGTTIHLTGELFKKVTGTDILHVPYRGSSPALQDLMAGRTDIMFDNISSALTQVRGGTLKALAITTSKRSPYVPELPLVADTLPGFDVSSWFGFSLPRKTPEAIVAKLAADTKAALADPDVKTKLEALAAEPVGSTVAEFTAFVQRETDVWGKVIKEGKIRAE